jgi:hypothetical protein
LRLMDDPKNMAKAQDMAHMAAQQQVKIEHYG